MAIRLTFPELTGWHIVAAVVTLHALALTCAVHSSRVRSDIASAALLISAALATLSGYLITYLYL